MKNFSNRWAQCLNNENKTMCNYGYQTESDALRFHQYHTVPNWCTGLRHRKWTPGLVQSQWDSQPELLNTLVSSPENFGWDWLRTSWVTTDEHQKSGRGEGAHLLLQLHFLALYGMTMSHYVGFPNYTSDTKVAIVCVYPRSHTS